MYMFNFICEITFSKYNPMSVYVHMNGFRNFSQRKGPRDNFVFEFFYICACMFIIS